MYADDIVLVATTEVGMKGILKRFRKYVERKGLTVNTEKSKVLVFERGRGRRRRRREWRWGEEELEEVKEMKYLGYIMEKNGKAEKHIQAGKDKESGGGDEKNVAHWRKVIQGRFRKKDKDVRSLSGECGDVRGRNLGLE